MGLRRRSIRLRISLLVLIPILSLLGLYIFVASITVGNAVDESRLTTLKNATGLPIGYFHGELEAERRLAVIYASAPAARTLAALNAQTPKTDQSQALMTRALASNATMGIASTVEKQSLQTLLRSAAGLNAIRSQVTSQALSPLQTLDAYNTIIANCDNAFKAVIIKNRDSALVAQGLALIEVSESADVLLQEDAVLESALAARSFSPPERSEFAQLVGARRALLAGAQPDISPADQVFYARDVNPQLAAALGSMEDAVIADTHSGPPPVDPRTWGTDVAAVDGGLTQAGTQAANYLSSRAAATARDIYVQLLLAVGLGLLALIASVVVSLRVGRGLVRQLVGLRASAMTLSEERLPRVMRRLRDGEEVDVSAEAPPLQTSEDEIGQVAQAFNNVQRTAVQAAVEQATLRRGVSDVFRNLARRSQSLLHRQLTLLDAMERRANDPDELGDLYRLDHLTTRMRRHAEGLIILSGAAPGRAWRNPVRLVDVLRASVAEVEDYTRVTVVTMTQAALAGPVVADVIHMIAELVENATIFSPPNTPVRLTGDMVARGFAIEIEDRGLGMNEEKLAEINERLANPPEFDLSDSDQLGLFVAGRLATRHNIRISMRLNPYGGTTAIVLIPRELVVSEDLFARDPAAALGSESAVQPTGRHASRSEDIIAAATPMGAHPYASNGLAGALAADSDEAADSTPGNGWAAHSSLAGNAIADLPELPGATGSSTSWFHRPGENEWPERGDPAGAHPGDEPPATGDLTELGLPRRIRQASLAPELRGPGPQNTTGVENEPGFRSPEEARATMTAIQQGWERGRSAPDGSDLGRDDPADGEQMGSKPASRAPMEVEE